MPGKQQVRATEGGRDRARLEHDLQCRREHCITSRLRWQSHQESRSVFATRLAAQLQLRSTRPALLRSSSAPETPAWLCRPQVRSISFSGRWKHRRTEGRHVHCCVCRGMSLWGGLYFCSSCCDGEVFQQSRLVFYLLCKISVKISTFPATVVDI